MWLLLTLCSAALLGFYDVFKKKAISGNAVIPVLFFNTLFSTLLFLPLIIGSYFPLICGGCFIHFNTENWDVHKWVFLKAIIVLSSWLCGYYAIKHLPITIVGPLNATRPILVIVGALLVFDERLNGWQWSGVILALIGIWLLRRESKYEGIVFSNNRWVWLLCTSVVLGAISGLYDRWLLQRVNPLFVQAWFNVYQLGLMSIILLLWWRKRKIDVFKWNWFIILIPTFICSADLLYYKSLSEESALISVVSMVRRSSVVISFTCGAIAFKERVAWGKVIDLILICLSLLLLWLGS